MEDMNTLDGIALNIELVLISIIEGVALGALAYSAAPVFQLQENWHYIPSVCAGLIILLVFWSQAIMHAISFIRWPLSIGHMFAYFLAAFLQAIAYYSILNITNWFFWWTLFSFVTVLLYGIDFRLLKQATQTFSQTPLGAHYIKEVSKRHLYEMKFLLPLSVLFNVVILLLLVYGNPLYVSRGGIFVLGSLQALVSFGALVDCMRNFRVRSSLIATMFQKG